MDVVVLAFAVFVVVVFVVAVCFPVMLMYLMLMLLLRWERETQIQAANRTATLIDSSVKSNWTETQPKIQTQSLLSCVIVIVIECARVVSASLAARPLESANACACHRQ